MSYGARPSGRRARAGAVVGAVTVVGAAGALLARLPGRAIDLEVYRTAGAVVRAGRPLYRDGYPYGLGVYLPFTYPPVAAGVLGLTSWLPSGAAVALVSALGLLALAVTARLSASAVGLDPVLDRVPLPLAAALAALAVGLEPVHRTLYLGQVNLLLMALVSADVLVARPRWPRGALIGLAAALKLTPLAFLLVLACRRQWKAVGTALVTFAAAQALGALVLPRDSRDYWLGGVLTAPGRIGAAETSANQSLRGVLARAWPGAPTALWLALVLVVGLLTLVATWRCTGRGDDLGALLSTAVGGLLVSPVSWTHHWVWVVPALGWLLARAHRERRARRARLRWLAATVVVVFVVAPDGLLPHGPAGEPRWSWWGHLVGDGYVGLGLAALVVGALAGPRPAWPRRRRATDPSTTSTDATTQAVVGSPGTRTPR